MLSSLMILEFEGCFEKFTRNVRCCKQKNGGKGIISKTNEKRRTSSKIFQSSYCAPYEDEVYTIAYRCNRHLYNEYDPTLNTATSINDQNSEIYDVFQEQ